MIDDKKYLLYLIVRICHELGLDLERYKVRGRIEVKPFLDDLVELEIVSKEEVTHLESTLLSDCGRMRKAAL